MQLDSFGEPVALDPAEAETDDVDEPDHDGCFQPHLDHNNEYIDCDGRPL